MSTELRSIPQIMKLFFFLSSFDLVLLWSKALFTSHYFDNETF